MISLFIDTSTNTSILALLIDSKIVNQITIKSNNDLSNTIFSYLDELLKKSNILVDNIGKIYIVVGPGSFTGIRVGVTIAKTMAWSKKIDIIPLSSLEVIASSSDKDTIIPYIDARRGYVFAGVYSNNLDAIMENKYIQFEELKSTYNGDFIDNRENANIEKIILKHQSDLPSNPHEINPIYLKLTEAEENHEWMLRRWNN